MSTDERASLMAHDAFRLALGAKPDHFSLAEVVAWLQTLENLATRSAMLDVLRERERQITKGWTREHDDEHTDGWIANAAADMLMTGQHAVPGTWAWKHKHPDSLDRLSRREQLIVGAAMALAEIERLDRAAAAKAA